MNGFLRLAGCFAVASVLCAPARAQLAPTYPDVEYANVGGISLRLDIYTPPGVPGPTPCVVWIHGGSWSGGDKSQIWSDAYYLTAGGLTVAAINYRLSSQAIWPAQIQDCKGAVRWLRAHAAQYNIDPARIGAYGPSAGAHLASMVGVSGDVAELEGDVGGNLGQSSRVQAVADLFGPTDFMNFNDYHNYAGSSASVLLGYTLGDIVANQFNPAYADLVALAESASPVHWVSSDDPPFHITHGDQDYHVLLNQSQFLNGALVAANVPVVFRIVPGVGHLDMPYSENRLIHQWFVDVFNGMLPPPAPRCNADLDFDGAVGAADLALLLGSWGTNQRSMDFNGDGQVNASDLAVILGSWGPCP